MAFAIGRACAMQVVAHLCPAWGFVSWDVIAGIESDVKAGDIPHYIFDTADVAGALGYHDVDPQGRAYIKTFAGTVLDNGGTLLDGSNSVSVTASHECCEAVVDENASMWNTIPDGTTLPSGKQVTRALVALESADPVEGDSYPCMVVGKGGTLIKVSVSNFVLPAWFDFKHPGPYDQMGLVLQPFETRPGGYLIVDEAGTVSQDFARMHPLAAWRQQMKAFPSARTAKRLKGRS